MPSVPEQRTHIIGDEHAMSWVKYEEYTQANYMAWAHRVRHFAAGWREILPETFDTAIVVRDGHFELHLELDGFGKRGQRLFNLIKDDPDWFCQLQWQAKEPVDRLFTFSGELRTIDFADFSDQDLWTTAESFLSIFDDAHKHGVLMGIVEFEHELLTKYLLNYLDNTRHPAHLKTSQLFTILTSSSRETNARRQKQMEQALLLEINSNANLRSAFETVESSVLTTQGLSTIDPVFAQRFHAYHKSFCWLSYGTDGPAWSEMQLIQSLQSLVKADKDPKLRLKDWQTENNWIQDQQGTLVKTLSIDERHQRLFQIARDSAYLKALRKEATSYAFYCAEGLFRQIAKRMKLAVSQLRLLLPDELGPAFLEKCFDSNELNSRATASSYVILSGAEHFLIGDKAEAFINGVHSQQVVSRDVTSLSGTCAVAGKVRGVVAIINTASEMSKMQEGNILVSCVTDVNLVPAMLKAGAIVTDSGGMISHAAIFARELGITCVVGTKVATKILADGDEVEVDAETGVVRILKRSQ